MAWLAVFFPQDAAAACCSCSAVVSAVESSEWGIGGPPQSGEGPTSPRIKAHVESELTGQRIWLISLFWEDNVLPALMMMADQLTAVAMQQMQIVGSFLDAKHQMETQQIIQRMRAQSHKDYQPSTGMCEFGSNVKSLAMAERQGEFNAIALSQRSQDRQLGNANTAAATGFGGDKESRLRQFATTYCDPQDNNNGMANLCAHRDGVGATDPKRMNKDIDFVRTIDFPWTLQVDFTDGNPSDDEEDIFALASNLFGEDVFSRIPTGLQGNAIENLTQAQSNFVDMRAVIAKRSVAENSFNAIVGLKSESLRAQNGPAAKDFMRPILKELGVQDADVENLLGRNPSYFAQMEVLTKKIYQNPDFYTNLYDKPANVARKGAAIDAIALMQKFDLFKSYLRQEASMSILLELAVMDLQQEVENEINQMSRVGDPASTR